VFIRLNVVNELIDRPASLAALRRWRERPVIKVVTGVRRCGKSTLLELFQQELIAGGVAPDHIVSLNLEDFALAHLGEASALHQYITARLAPSGTTYVFIDEVQLVDQFERVVNSLQLRPQADLYVTGSNARMLSGELATLLSGRYVEIELQPLSLAEFAQARRDRAGAAEDLSPAGLYASYLRFGGFPLVQDLIPDLRASQDYLDGIVSTVLLKDVAVRQNVSSAAMLRDVTGFLFQNVGNLTSLRRVSDSLRSAGRSPSPNTVESYLTGLIDAYLLYPVERWDVKGLRRLSGPAKYYCVDPALRASLVGNTGGDIGHVLENLVFLELHRRHGRVRIGHSSGGEIDFLAGEGVDLAYYQVAASVHDPATLARELGPLQAVRDHRPKFLLTLDPEPPATHDGIVQRPVVEWLLEDDRQV
jgi:predicted AAA+ superfamily ATPase